MKDKRKLISCTLVFISLVLLMPVANGCTVKLEEAELSGKPDDGEIL